MTNSITPVPIQSVSFKDVFLKNKKKRSRNRATHSGASENFKNRVYPIMMAGTRRRIQVSVLLFMSLGVVGSNAYPWGFSPRQNCKMVLVVASRPVP